MARGAKGCQNCHRCNRSLVGKVVKGAVRRAANVSTLGVVTAVRKKCGVCGHPVADHDTNVVEVATQAPSLPYSVPVPPVVVERSIATASVADELGKLAQLRSEGILNEAEFEAQKSRLLGS